MRCADWEASRESPSPPLAAMLLTLQGAGAYDAAVHCASVSAARRMLQERLVAASVPSISDGSSSIRWLQSSHYITIGLSHPYYVTIGLYRAFVTHLSSCLSGVQPTTRCNWYGQAEVVPFLRILSLIWRIAMIQGEFSRPRCEAIRPIWRRTIHNAQRRLCHQPASQEAHFRRCVAETACSV